jgi:hypothetical protein
MNTFKIAHINHQGQDIIIVPFPSSFHNQAESQKQETLISLQHCANASGLAGAVCIVWEHFNQFYFIAPSAWHPFFRSINMDFVAAQLNRELVCQD